jgi:hypothetical protein
MLERIRCAAALIIVLSVSVPCAAAAQTPSMPQTRDPKACSDRQGSQAGTTAPQPSGPGTRDLSERLAQTDGVLCPPNIDPDINAPTPEAGRMPVIPPPGGPGGDPTVRPK